MVYISKLEKKRRDELQKSDEDNIRGYFELLGWNVKKIDIDNESKKPDFLVTKGGYSFYSEVKSFFEQNEIIEKNDSIEKFTHKIKSLFCPRIDYGWCLSVSQDAMKLNETDLMLRLNSFGKIIEEKSKEGIPEKTELYDTLFNIDLDISNKTKKLIFVRTYGNMIRSPRRLRDLIHKAAKKFDAYKHDDNSKILIVCKNDFFLALKHFEDALYGDMVIQFNLNRDKKSHIIKRKNAFFMQGKNTRLSAIVFCEKIYSEKTTIPDLRFAVFHNPYSPNPLPIEIFRQKHNMQHVPEEIKFEWLKH